MKLRLDALLEGLDATLHGDPATVVTELYYDSRAVGPGGLFAALRGEQTDGHRFAADAVKRGAAALLLEEPPAGLAAGVPYALVADTRRAMAEVAARLFDHPARDLLLIGVTGTNGKTSTVRLIASILDADGRRVGSLGTISVRWPGGEEPARLTTPESADLQRYLARIRHAGGDAAVMEVSSHSLAQERIRPLRFDAAVYTNLSQDHLDFHGDMAGYARAKARLFDPDHLRGVAVLNACDPLLEGAADAARNAGRPVIRFGRGADSGADVRSERESVDLGGARIAVRCGGELRELEVPLPGDFQIENALAAAAAAHALGVCWEAIEKGVASCPPIPGRLERVGSGRPVVLVDYAHTPDALEQVLERVRPLVTGRLIALFGCGGDRDRSKRAPMARAACRHSDYVVATSDNPRSEDPESILRDVMEGLSGPHEVVVERCEAIHRAIALADPDDVVVIAGKGHEDYQIVGGTRLPFDDRVEARRALDARGGTA